MARSWAVSAFGPVDHGGVDGVRRALTTAMSQGPRVRLGLVPDPNSRTWRYDPDRVLGAVRRTAPIDPADYGPAMAAMLADCDPEEPISIRLCGDHALIALNHGIGDGQMTLNLSHTVANASARLGVVPAWATDRDEKRPLLRAAVGWYAQEPRRLLALRKTGDHNHTPDQGHGVEHTPWTPSYAAAYAQSTEAETDNLLKWRKANSPTTSSSALMYAALTRALRNEGIQVENVLKVLFNVRRYLTPGRTTLANLAAGIDLHLDDAGNPTEINRAVRQCIRSGRPIANLALGTLKSKLARHSRADLSGDAVVPVGPSPIKLTITDMGRSEQANDLDWIAGPDQSHYAAIATTEGPQHITIAMGRRGNSYKITASFHDNVVDPEAVQRALTAACTRPTELLERDTG